MNLNPSMQKNKQTNKRGFNCCSKLSNGIYVYLKKGNTINVPAKLQKTSLSLASQNFFFYSFRNQTNAHDSRTSLQTNQPRSRVLPCGGAGRGYPPIVGYTGKLLPKGVPFYIIVRVVYKRVGYFSILKNSSVKC